MASFWKEQWVLGFTEFSEVSLVELDENKLIEKVADYVMEDGEWDWEALNLVLPEEVTDIIHTIKAPNPYVGDDFISWLANPNGNFSIQSAYETFYSDRGEDNRLYKHIWKAKLPQRLKSFSWLITHDALMTNFKRKKRGLTDDGSCQDAEMMMRLCSICCMTVLSSAPSGIALSINSQQAQIQHMVIALAANYNYILNITEQNSKILRLTRTLEVGWEPPEEDWAKLNVDGSVFQPGSRGASGGIIRDSRERFLARFSMNIGKCTITIPELWGSLWV
ncbi:hypothetical protein AHAS_Ahas20G0108700 [Arachis hypogaea]